MNNISPIQPKYIIDKADWSLFKALTRINVDPVDKDIDEMVGILTDTIDVAAQQSILRTMGTISKHPVPWWTPECKLANNERKIALRHQQSKLMTGKSSYNRARAKARLVKRRAKSSSWQQYVSSINCNTPMGKVWKSIRKIRGSHTTGPSPCIQYRGEIVMDQQKVTNIMADHYFSVRSNNNYSPHFLAIKHRRKQTS